MKTHRFGVVVELQMVDVCGHVEEDEEWRRKGTNTGYSIRHLLGGCLLAHCVYIWKLLAFCWTVMDWKHVNILNFS